MVDIFKELNKYKDEKYGDFTYKLIPNIERNSIIGIRFPDIKKIAKKINGEDRKTFIKDFPHKYNEENLLHAFLINDINNIDELINELNTFLPYINNWSVSDSIKPKIFKNNTNKVYEYVKKCLKSKHTYTLRFGICTLLNYFLDENFKPEYNELISNIRSSEYYVNMAIAWYFSYALIKQYKDTIHIFESKYLDKWVHNKSIQKAIESYRISEDTKSYLRSLKVK